jgi:hypothetical protein
MTLGLDVWLLTEDVRRVLVGCERARQQEQVRGTEA